MYYFLCLKVINNIKYMHILNINYYTNNMYVLYSAKLDMVLPENRERSDSPPVCYLLVRVNY